VEQLFRLDGAVRLNPEVDRWLDERTGELGALARQWFERIRQCGDDVVDLLHDGYATACVGDAAFAYVGVFRAHVNVGFFHGADLYDPAGLLEGSGVRMRHVRVTPGGRLDPEALSALIESAYGDIKARLG
jgi:hypothetical protein